MEVYLGTVLAFGFQFAPRGWATCQGQILSISQNTALFSLLGTTYGGNGQTTFGLPNLQGRSIVGQGNAPFGSYSMGQMSGNTSVTMTTAQMPMHTHVASTAVSIPAYSEGGNSPAPTDGSLAALAGTNLYTDQVPDVHLKPFNSSVTVGIAGGSQPLDITNPYLTMNYSIALQGIFPPRD